MEEKYLIQLAKRKFKFGMFANTLVTVGAFALPSLVVTGDTSYYATDELTFGTGSDVITPRSGGVAGVPGRIKLDISSDIIEVKPKETPFLVLMSNLSKGVVKSAEYEWSEDEPLLERSVPCAILGVSVHPTRTNFKEIRLRLLNPGDARAFETSKTEPTITSNTAWGTHGEMYINDFRRNTAAAPVPELLGIGGEADDNGVVGFVPNNGHTDIFANGNTKGIDYQNPGDIYIWVYDSVGAVAAGGDGLWTVTTGTINTRRRSITDENGTVNVYGGFQEGTGVPDETRKMEKWMKQYTQIFKNSYEVTGTVMASDMLIGGPIKNVKALKCWKKHKIDIESGMLFNGDKRKVYPTQHPLRQMKGLGIGITDGSAWISTNNGSWGTATTNPFVLNIGVSAEARWRRIILMSRLAAEYNDGDSAVFWASKTWKEQFAFMAQEAAQLQVNMGETLTRWGVNVTEITTPHQVIYYVNEPMFKGQWEGYGMMLNLDYVQILPLQTRDTTLYPNVELPGYDGERHLIQTETSLKVAAEYTHSIWRLESDTEGYTELTGIPGPPSAGGGWMGATFPSIAASPASI